jgi:hypothetical protein
LLNPETGCLEIVAQVGFDEKFLHTFAEVPAGIGTCGAAFEQRERLIVHDVFQSQSFGYLCVPFADSGLVGCQSTPVISASGAVLGMLNTHFARPFELSPGMLRRLDSYLARASTLIETGSLDRARRASALDRT